MLLSESMFILDLSPWLVTVSHKSETANFLPIRMYICIAYYDRIVLVHLHTR